MRYSAGLVTGLSSFNPLPPRRVGDALNRGGGGSWGIGFNPLPPRRVGDAGTPHRPRCLSRFQSAPTPEGGRCDGAVDGPVLIACFNPLPPRRVGDA